MRSAKAARSRAQRVKKSRKDSDYIEYRRSCAIARTLFHEAQRKFWFSYIESVCEDKHLSKIWKNITHNAGKIH